MAFNSFMNMVRQWDNKSNQWFVRHFYVLFFEIILVVAFVFFFAMTVNTLNAAADVPRKALLEKLIIQQNAISLLIVFLLLLNSFWMLFMFSGTLKIRSVLKNMDYNLSRRKTDRKPDDAD